MGVRIGGSFFISNLLFPTTKPKKCEEKGFGIGVRGGGTLHFLRRKEAGVATNPASYMQILSHQQCNAMQYTIL